jgi:hypothetical protein
MQLVTSQHLKLHATYIKTVSVLPPEDRRLTPETCRGLRHNKVFMKMYLVGCVIVIQHVNLYPAVKILL